MSARARDLFKTRANRVGEVLRGIALGTGAADSQVNIWGNALSVNGTTTKFDVAAGEVVLGQAVVAVAASTAIVLDTGAATAAGEFRKVLVERTSAGAVVQVVGDKATSQALAAKPAPTAANIVVGYIEIPASFTPGTTAITGGMLKVEPYSAA